MGKDLKGKKLPAGICQRKDGLYSARFTSKTGRRVEKFFKKPNEAKKWLEDAKYEDKHNNIGASSQMTVDAWFDYWITEIKAPTVRFNTVRNYTERYNINIKPYLGNMIISEVKAMHCQNVLNAMADKYKGSTIEQCRITMCSMFYYAAINGIIPISPISKIVKLPKKVEKKVRFLTVEEQNKFLQQAEGSAYYHQFLLVLQTGLRTGELVGLKWEDLDFENRKITVSRSMEFRYGYQEFKIGEPKSKHGYRTIPMTQTAYDILKRKASEVETRYVCDKKYADFVFLCRKGSPIKNSTYDTALYKLTEKAGIEHISMHTLRHTFATRCIEAGMRPKTLQGILGHANIDITMNLYVHNTEEEKEKEIKKFEEAFGVKMV